MTEELTNKQRQMSNFGEPQETQLVVVDSPTELMNKAQTVADVCRKVVEQLAIQIRGKKYLPVEAWQTIAAAYGFAAGARDVERTSTGWSAVGELRRISDGLIIATAEGFVGDDEKWGAEYACRAKAQTRAISRVCRSAFAFVVVLISKDLATTPVEEMPPEEKHDRTGRRTTLKTDSADREAGIKGLINFLSEHGVPEAFVIQLCVKGNLADGSEEFVTDLKDGVIKRLNTGKMREAIVDRWKKHAVVVVETQKAEAEKMKQAAVWKRPMKIKTDLTPSGVMNLGQVEKWQDVIVPSGNNKDIALGDLTPKQRSYYVSKWTPKEAVEGGYDDIEMIFDAALTLAAEET